MNRNMSDSPEVFGCGRCGVEFLGHSVPITARCVYRHFKKHHREMVRPFIAAITKMVQQGGIPASCAEIQAELERGNLAYVTASDFKMLRDMGINPWTC